MGKAEKIHVLIDIAFLLACSCLLKKTPSSIGQTWFYEQVEIHGFISVCWDVLSAPSLIYSPTMCHGVECTTDPKDRTP